MIGLTSIVALQIAFLTAPPSAYQEAFDQADKEGKPLLVLVGADWCPGCRTMKDEMIPELEREGDLAQVVFATVNTDEKPALSKRLLRGNSIPQLVLYTRNARGWRRSQLTGVHESRNIRQFLRNEIESTRVAEDAKVGAE